MLAEQAGHMRAPGRERVIERRRNHHLDDGRAAPPQLPCVTERAVHVSKARRKDDSRGVMICNIPPRQCGKAWQLRERDIHAERAGGTAPPLHALKKIRIERTWRNERGIEELRIEI